MTTGHANIHMLGIQTANTEITRGSRQGNNALINYESSWANFKERLPKKLCSTGVSFDLLNHVQIEQNYFNVYKAIRYGHRKLAVAMIEAWATFDFSDLHINTLKLDKTPLPKFMPVSTTKQGT
uniref:Uncharacterized protein n=1 Tax=Panagrolaimus davidi TaxID=227884 RepID=A0A914PWM6_9BILA